MEYPEPEEPGIVVEQVREANVLIPNIPVPRSSDGEVCNFVLILSVH
jgi:RNA polymerase-associated protein LEO1